MTSTMNAEAQPFATTPRPAIVMTSRDRDRLLALASDPEKIDSSVARFLVQEIQRAEILPVRSAVAGLVVMGSEVEFIASGSNAVRRGTLVYPDQAHEHENAISVMTPIGAALLGLGPGQAIDWVTETGESGWVAVLDVHQPTRRTAADLPAVEG